MLPPVPAPVAVSRQEWTAVTPPVLGLWAPTMTVTVVLPARDCQPELDLTLAALSEQTYPADLTDVVVVDDDSATPLQLPELRPERSRILRLGQGDGHGSGRARDAGARAATGDIVLFLDADMVTTRTHVEAHARWHHVMADAVVLGTKLFVDVTGISAADVRDAARDDSFDRLLQGRRLRRHTWFEEFIHDSEELTRYSEDTFIAVVGASVSTTRSLYEESGGFASFGLRGIVDTEFGYRIFTAGGVIVPDTAARSYHQGERSFKARGDEIKRERLGLAANHLPIPLFRPANAGRSWVVPMVRAIVDAGGTPEEVLVTVDSILASSFTDLAVTVSPADALPRWVAEYFSGDPRVTMAPSAVDTGFPSPFSLVVPAGVVVGVDTVRALTELSVQHGVGLVRAALSGDPAPPVELWATRALHRARRHHRGDLDAAARQLFGEHWVSGGAVGVRRADIAVTRQGMVVDEGPSGG